MVAALAVGAAYSLPPLRLKRFPIAASLCISRVRSAVVNLGVYGHFSLAFGGDAGDPGPVWALTLFVLPFSFAIAVLKDVPDIEGDRRYRIATFTVRLGAARAARLGLGALVLAYAGMTSPAPLLLDDVAAGRARAGHLPRSPCCWPGRGASIRRSAPRSPASTCASGGCSSSSTRSCRSRRSLG